MIGASTCGLDMTSQKRLSGKNYIDLVEEDRERHFAEFPPEAVRAIKDYLMALVEAIGLARTGPK